MANTYFSMNNLGIDFDRRTTAPEFSTGAQCWTNDQKVAVYVQANGSVSASGTSGAITTASQFSDTGGTVINTVAFADDEWGWVLVPQPNPIP